MAGTSGSLGITSPVVTIRLPRASRPPAAASGLVIGRVAAPVALAEPGKLGPFPASGLLYGHAVRLHLEPTRFACTPMLSRSTARVVRDPDVLHSAAATPDRVTAPPVALGLNCCGMDSCGVYSFCWLIVCSVPSSATYFDGATAAQPS